MVKKSNSNKRNKIILILLTMMTTIQYFILSGAGLTVRSDAKFDNRGCWGGENGGEADKQMDRVGDLKRYMRYMEET